MTYLDYNGSLLLEEDLQSLRTNGLLNDRVVNLALLLLHESLPQQQQTDIHLCSSFVLTSLRLLTAASVWSSKRSRTYDFFSRKFVLFPICLDSHWSMVALVRPDLLVPGASNPNADLPCFMCMDSLDDYHDKRAICRDLRSLLITRAAATVPHRDQWGRYTF